MHRLPPESRGGFDVAVVVLDAMRVRLRIKPGDDASERSSFVGPVHGDASPDGALAQQCEIRPDVSAPGAENHVDLRAPLRLSNAAQRRQRGRFRARARDMSRGERKFRRGERGGATHATRPTRRRRERAASVAGDGGADGSQKFRLGGGSRGGGGSRRRGFPRASLPLPPLLRLLQRPAVPHAMTQMRLSGDDIVGVVGVLQELVRAAPLEGLIAEVHRQTVRVGGVVGAQRGDGRLGNQISVVVHVKTQTRPVTRRARAGAGPARTTDDDGDPHHPTAA